MKIFRVICLILSGIFFLFQLVAYPALITKGVEGASFEDKLGYILGYHIFLYVAIILLIIAFRIKRKIRMRSMEKTIDSFLTIENVS